MSDPIEEAPLPKIPSPAQLRGVAATLRAITPFQATQPFAKILGMKTLRLIADSLDECARLRSTTAQGREHRLQERADALAVLATSRRLPLAAIEGLIRRTEEGGGTGVPISALREALAVTEPRL